MKILVAVKRVLDYSVPIRVRADKSGVDGVFPKFSMNPFCEIALEEAVRLRERGCAKEVVAVSLGPQQAQDTLRSALALGADRALHVPVPTGGELQPLAVAKLLAAVAARESPVGLVLLGKQAIDDDANQTGQMLSGLLSWPQATFASKLELDAAAGRAQVTREVDGGHDVVAVRLPAVVTTDLRLNTPRFVTLPNTLKAKKKPIETLSLEALGVDITPQLQTVEVCPPPPRPGGSIVSSASELLHRLRTEAKVL